MSDEVAIVLLDVESPKDRARNERIGGLIDLELGPKSKWVLVYRSGSDNRTCLVTPPGERVHAREAAEVLVAMGKGLHKALSEAMKSKKDDN